MVPTGDGEDKRLLAACVPSGERFDVSSARDYLARRLPDYMIPQLWAVVEATPLTRNGKVDRVALEALAHPHRRVEDTGPNTQLEDIRTLVAVVLEGSSIAGNESFFTAGGDSLRVAKLVALVRERFGVELRLRDFLADPTPDALTRLVKERLERRANG